MKKINIMGLITGLLIIVLVGLSHAALDITDDAYNDNNPCDWSEFNNHDGMNSDIAMLSENNSEEGKENGQHIIQINKIETATGFPLVIYDVYVEGNQCDWSEFESH